MKVLPEILEFEWDEGNAEKSLLKHGVTARESEEAFFDRNKVAFTDVLHSGKEERFRLIGKTYNGCLLFIVYTVRGNLLRIISARHINRREEYLYEKTA